MTPTAYIVTPSTTDPDKEGYYCILTKDRYYTAYWTGEEWRYYKNVPEKSAHTFDSWLRPVDLSRMLEDCWKAAVEREDMGDWVQIEEDSPPPDMETYINSVLNPPK